MSIIIIINLEILLYLYLSLFGAISALIFLTLPFEIIRISIALFKLFMLLLTRREIIISFFFFPLFFFKE